MVGAAGLADPTRSSLFAPIALCQRVPGAGRTARISRAHIPCRALGRDRGAQSGFHPRASGPFTMCRDARGCPVPPACTVSATVHRSWDRDEGLRVRGRRGFAGGAGRWNSVVRRRRHERYRPGLPRRRSRLGPRAHRWLGQSHPDLPDRSLRRAHPHAGIERSTRPLRGIAPARPMEPRVARRTPALPVV